jgi:NF-X1-type zinc finger protein NFXL1
MQRRRTRRGGRVRAREQEQLQGREKGEQDGIERHQGKSAQERFDAWQAEHQLRVSDALTSLSRSSDSAAVSPETNREEQDSRDDTGTNSSNALWERLTERYVATGGVVDASRAEELFGGGVNVEQLLGAHETVCLVCLDVVEPQDGIWSCRQCCCVLHLRCIQSWVANRLRPRTALSAEAFPDREEPWNCPKCREEFSPAEAPEESTCWCGKLRDPPFNPWNAPHSCGEVCGKALVLLDGTRGSSSSSRNSSHRAECGHSCTMVCHPGQCPPCPATLRSSCFCGAVTRPQRCSKQRYSCGQVCGRLLACGEHSCEHPCHDGPCADCPRTAERSCRCGMLTQERPCSEKVFLCRHVCGKPLACEKHSCPEQCCPGPCDPAGCPGERTRQCPCGARAFGPGLEPLVCTSEPPACRDSTCGKQLRCRDGSHLCSERCHRGDCPPCRESILQRCRCGSTERQVNCALPPGGSTPTVQCNKRCPRTRSCGVHACKKKCCLGDCEIAACPETCGKVLQCGNTSHRCKENCHKGACSPCTIQIAISCACGDTTHSVPCGAEHRVTNAPTCSSPCRRPPLCHHSTVRPHKCHFGAYVFVGRLFHVPSPLTTAVPDVPAAPTAATYPMRAKTTNTRNKSRSATRTTMTARIYAKLNVTTSQRWIKFCIPSGM